MEKENSELNFSIKTILNNGLLDSEKNGQIEISLSTNITDKININGTKFKFDEKIENTIEEFNSLKLSSENISKQNQNKTQNDEKNEDIIIKTYEDSFKEIRQRVDNIGKILELWRLSKENEQNIISKKELFCHFCKIIGHREISCRQKKLFNKQNLKPIATRHDNDPRYPPSKTVYLPRPNYRQERIMLYRNGGFKDKFLYQNKNKLKTIDKSKIENKYVEENESKEESEASQVLAELLDSRNN